MGWLGVGLRMSDLTAPKAIEDSWTVNDHVVVVVVIGLGKTHAAPYVGRSIASLAGRVLAVEFEFVDDPEHGSGLVVDASLARGFRKFPRVREDKERGLKPVLRNRALLAAFSQDSPTEFKEMYPAEQDNRVLLSLPSSSEVSDNICYFLAGERPDPNRSTACNQLAAYVLSALAAAIALPSSDFLVDPMLPCEVGQPRPRVVSLVLKTQGPLDDPVLRPVSPNHRKYPVGSRYVFAMGRKVKDGPIRLVGLTGRSAVCSISNSRDYGEILARNSCLNLVPVLEYYRFLMPDQPEQGESRCPVVALRLSL